MQLPKAFLEEIRARVPVSDIVGKRTKLTRAGREFKGCCPFHKEKTPSFYVNDQKGFYHCFGCGAHGDVVGFLMNHDNMAFMDAVEQLAGIAGMQVPKPSKEEQQKFARQMSQYDLMEQATKWYEAQLHDPRYKKILDYLRGRGLSLETIKSFRLGFAPPEEMGLSQQLKKSGYAQEDMMEVGLFRASERKAGEVYPFFRNRVIFPVQDFQGRVVAFGGRVLPESHGGPADKSAPKYVNSPESSIFHKGRMLYGLSRARKAIGDGDAVIVVEGYMDVIALAQAGFRAAVAPLGTALTEAQVEEIWKTMPSGTLRAPILCFDGDTAGQRAASRSLERVLPILKPDHSVKFAFLPEEHDPDSLIRAQGVQAMQRELDSAISVFEMLWNEEAQGRNLSQPENKAGFRSALEKRARQISNNTVQEFFIHELNQKIKEVFLSNKSTQAAYTKRLNTDSKWQKNKQNIAQMPHRSPVKQVTAVKGMNNLRERILIAAMINHPALFEDFGEELGMVDIQQAEHNQLRRDLTEFLSRAEAEEIYLDDQAVKQHLNQLGHGKILDAIFDKSLYLHAGFVKPDQPPETVRQGWQDTYSRGQENAAWKKR